MTEKFASSRILKEIIALQKKAGEIMMRHFRTRMSVAYKDSGELVTEVDHHVEQFLIEHLKKIIPDANYIAEESGDHGLVSRYAFIIDPIDGTTNYARSISPFCIGVAVAEFEVPIIASVYNPRNGDLFFAIRGKGAFHNGRPIHTSLCHEFSKSVVHLSRRIDLPHKKILPKTRTFGSTLLALSYVAGGYLDGEIRIDATPWDCAAGALLVTEAGGTVTNEKGKPWTLNDFVCVASNGILHKKILGLLKS